MRLLRLLLWTVFILGSAKCDPLRACDPIRIEMCRDLGYNVTSMPNFVGHELQQDAELQLQTFSPLIQYGCSSQLKFFLCSVYVPMCTDKVPVPIGPCQSLCESVRTRCQPVLQEFGFPWPAALNCSKFPPENNQVHMCMEGPGEEASDRDTTVFGHHGSRRYPNTRQRGNNSPAVNNQYPVGTGTRNRDPVLPGARPHPPSDIGTCSRYRTSDAFVYLNRTGRCAQRCSAEVLFRSDDKRLAGVWMAVWSIVCFVSTSFTVLTFFMDPSKFRYPERPIIFMSVAYNLRSVGYLVRVVAGRDDIGCQVDGLLNGDAFLTQEGPSNTNCAIVFLLLYYFGMASAVWWVILCLTWFLAAGLRWSHEAIERHSTYFHLAAWALPAAKTIAALVLRVVDADELTGTCFVGNQNLESLLGFVLAPHFAYLVTGTGFLIVGFMRIQRHHHVHSPKMEVLVIRIGIFSVLYTVPATCVVATYFYDYSNREQWLLAGSTGRPSIEVFMLKIFMASVVGITSGMWIWSSKSMSTWQKLCRQLTHRKQPTPSYLLTVPMVNKQLISIEKSNSKRLKVAFGKTGSETAV